MALPRCFHSKPFLATRRLTEKSSVSVVVPCLNRAAFLRPTIESVLEQDYRPIECIVVDGGSTDGTIEILKSYGDRIRWVSESDNGHADAINKGWRLSSGVFLAWLNADDVWSTPTAVREAVAVMKARPEVDVVYGDCGRIDLNGAPLGVMRPRDWDLDHAVLDCDFMIYQPAAFIRRDILEKVGWLDTAFHQKKDHELWIRIALSGGRFARVPNVLAHERAIKGLSFEGNSAAEGCIQLTKKIYASPALPDSLRRKRATAFGTAHLRAAAYAFHGGRKWGLVFRHLLCAVPTHPLRALRSLWDFFAEASETDDAFLWFRPVRRIGRRWRG